MTNLANKPPLGLKLAPPPKSPKHLARVAELPCVICHRRPVQVHHCICGRYGTRKASDYETIPLCRDCHLDGPNAIHRDKRAWVERNGPDYEFLPVVADMLAGELNE